MTATIMTVMTEMSLPWLPFCVFLTPDNPKKGEDSAFAMKVGTKNGQHVRDAHDEE